MSCAFSGGNVYISSPYCLPMIDLKFLREHPDIMKKNLEKRNDLQKLAWVDEILEKDAEHRKLPHFLFNSFDLFRNPFRFLKNILSVLPSLPERVDLLGNLVPLAPQFLRLGEQLPMLGIFLKDLVHPRELLEVIPLLEVLLHNVRMLAEELEVDHRQTIRRGYINVSAGKCTGHPKNETERP